MTKAVISLLECKIRTGFGKNSAEPKFSEKPLGCAEILPNRRNANYAMIPDTHSPTSCSYWEFRPKIRLITHNWILLLALRRS